MIRSVLSIIGLFLLGIVSGFSQTDSTDLDLYFSDAVLETSLDSMIYPVEEFDFVELDFTISDTVGFNSVHVELKNETTGELLLRRNYSLTDLETDSLLVGWEVSLPFGNFPNGNTYKVEVIIADYSGALGATIQKTLTP